MPDDSADKPRWTSYDAHASRMSRRRDKIVAEIERNRRGENRVPTWALALILLGLIAGITAIIVFSG
jgi:fatty acid desaturase